jgi:hypothetical protein
MTKVKEMGGEKGCLIEVDVRERAVGLAREEFERKQVAGETAKKLP